MSVALFGATTPFTPGFSNEKPRFPSVEPACSSRVNVWNTPKKRSTSVTIGSLIGADPDQLESLGTTLCRQRESVESIVSLVTSTLAGTAWVGPARQAFESDWESSFRSALSRLSDAFDMAGRDCSARAIELRRVMGRM
ncbi:MAG: hypothetical protein RIS33_553 [Actinomycetota bacterium]